MLEAVLVGDLIVDPVNCFFFLPLLVVARSEDPPTAAAAPLQLTFYMRAADALVCFMSLCEGLCCLEPRLGFGGALSFRLKWCLRVSLERNGLLAAGC